MSTRLEFGTQEISLEAYLERADPHILNDHDALSSLITHLDPRIMIPFESLSERLIPLRREDLVDLRVLAFIKPMESIETIRFNFPHSTHEDHDWWEAIGDPIKTVELLRLNLDPTTVGLQNWKLLLLRRTPAEQPGDDWEFSFGWVNKEELERLREIAKL